MQDAEDEDDLINDAEGEGELLKIAELFVCEMFEAVGEEPFNFDLVQTLAKDLVLLNPKNDPNTWKTLQKLVQPFIADREQSSEQDVRARIAFSEISASARKLIQDGKAKNMSDAVRLMGGGAENISKNQEVKSENPLVATLLKVRNTSNPIDVVETVSSTVTKPEQEFMINESPFSRELEKVLTKNKKSVFYKIAIEYKAEKIDKIKALTNIIGLVQVNKDLKLLELVLKEKGVEHVFANDPQISGDLKKWVSENASNSTFLKKVSQRAELTDLIDKASSAIGKENIFHPSRDR